MSRSGPSFLRRVWLRFATHFAIHSARRDSINRANRLPVRRLLVLCYGNIYRSPLVAAYLHRILPEGELIEIRSAGFHPKPGRSSPRDFVHYVLNRTGIDLSSHRSQWVGTSDTQWADAILIMDRHNWHALARLDSASASKVIWLGAFLPSGTAEIEDPYGRPASEVEAIVDRVMAAAQGLVAHVAYHENR